MKNRKTFSFKSAIAVVLCALMLLPFCVSGASAEEKFYMSDNLALDQNTSASASYSKGQPALAVDESLGTCWRTLSSCADKASYFVVSFDEPTEVNVLNMALYEPQNMDCVIIEYTTSATPHSMAEWKELVFLEGKDITSNVIVDFDTVSATGIRFYVEVLQHSVGLYEFEVYYSNDTERAKAVLEGTAKGEFRDITQNASVDAKLVSVGKNGELIYAPYDDNGATLIDFSRAGYKQGEAEIPDVKVVKTIDANYRANHTALIQAAIDEVAALPESERGAILLKAGTYTVTDTITISASGIVLRGEGQGENGTIIYDARKTAGGTTMQIKGAGNIKVISGTKSTLADTYVPMGALDLELSSVEKYSAGDNIRITCTPNDLWVQTLGMDVIPQNSTKDVEQWKAKDFVITYERAVTAVDAAKNTVTLDTAIPLTLDSKYYATTVDKIEDNKGRITECGIENIRFISYFDESVVGSDGRYVDENHPYTAISTGNCRNCWVRDITSLHYYSSCVCVGGGSINVTVDSCSSLAPVSKVEGGRRYPFYLSSSQYVLVKNCYSYDSRHDYVLNSRVSGPNVFLDSIAEDSNNASEPHHRWSTGVLYDNIYQTGAIRLGYLAAINAGNNGTGHGWMGANTIFWNCLSPATIVGKPQTEQNFAIGVYGLYEIRTALKNSYIQKRYYKFTTPTIVTPNYPATQTFEGSPLHGTGYIESPYNPVNPSSLYKAQLSYRLYGDATKNVKPAAPILNYPAYDTKSETYSVTFSGVCDKNADKVYVYVNGEKHEANITNKAYNDYSLTLYLENGYYDISVSQEIGGIESDCNAVRTILVDSKEVFNPDAGNEDETTAPDTGDDNVGNNDNNDGEKGSIVLPVVIIAACAVVGGVAAFVVVKKSKKTK